MGGRRRRREVRGCGEDSGGLALATVGERQNIMLYSPALKDLY